MFYGCNLLSYIKPLEIWEVSKGNNFENMFFECSELLDLKPLEKWNFPKEKLNKIIFELIKYNKF